MSVLSRIEILPLAVEKSDTKLNQNHDNPFELASQDEIVTGIRAVSGGYNGLDKARRYIRNLRWDCVFHAIRPRVPRTSGQTFHEHPATRSMSIRPPGKPACGARFHRLSPAIRSRTFRGERLVHGRDPRA
jgi:hypothetical protein